MWLHGGVTKKTRDDMVERFQDGHGPAVFLLSLKAGGTGLNLTAATQVVHFDRWWNPAVEDQATDRAFRIGQKRNVQVRKFVCGGTLEERIDAMIETKRALAERIVGNRRRLDHRDVDRPDPRGRRLVGRRRGRRLMPPRRPPRQASDTWRRRMVAAAVEADPRRRWAAGTEPARPDRRHLVVAALHHGARVGRHRRPAATRQAIRPHRPGDQHGDRPRQGDGVSPGLEGEALQGVDRDKGAHTRASGMRQKR